MADLVELMKAFKGITVHDSFKQIVNQLESQPIFVKNTKGEFIYVNSIFMGHCRSDSMDDILGKTDHDFFNSVLVKKYIADDRKVLETGRPLLNRLEIAPNFDQAPAWQITHKFPLHDSNNQVCGLIGTIEVLLKKSPHKNPKIFALIPAIDYIRENFAESISMGDLAAVCNISERTFYRYFKQVFEMTPQNYLQKHRVLEALELFRFEYSSIAEVAIKCGFYDHSNFTKKFKRYMLTTPKKYLQKMKELK